MSDFPDFASDASASAPDDTQALEQAAPASPAPQEAPAAPPAVAAQPAPASFDPASPAPSDAEQAAAHGVPLATYLNMRDEANAAKQEAKALREWRQQQEAAANRQPPPSREEDPDAYEQHQQATFHAALQAQRVDVSYMMAEQKHGPEVTKTARDWGFERCAKDPLFNARVMQQPDPVGFVVAEWRREQVNSKVDPTDIEEYLAWKAAKGGDPANPQPSPQAAPNAPPARPQAPRASIAAAPSAGASADPQPLGAERTFERMFGS